MKIKTKKTPVVASPMLSISHQQSKKAAKAMMKVNVPEKEDKNPRKLEKILVALDGSDKSIEALDFTLNLNKMLNAELELLTVNQNLVYPWLFPATSSTIAANPSYVSDFSKVQKQYSKKILEEACKRAEMTEPKFKITKKVINGLPATKIIEEAGNGFDLIVMGSRGHGFLEELVLGSVSKRVVDGSKVPVLVVK